MTENSHWIAHAFVICIAAMLFFSCHSQKIQEDRLSYNDSIEEEIVTQEVRAVFADAKDKWYVVNSFSLCDSAKTSSDDEMLNPYNVWVTYDTTVSHVGDSSKVSFDFVADCCLDFLGRMSLHSDTLALEYGYAYDMLTPCDCYCQYRMAYRFPRRKWKVMTIENMDGKKPFK